MEIHTFESRIFFLKEIDFNQMRLGKKDDAPMFTGKVTFEYDLDSDQWEISSLVDIQDPTQTNLLFTIGKNRLEYLNHEIFLYTRKIRINRSI